MPKLVAPKTITRKPRRTQTQTRLDQSAHTALWSMAAEAAQQGMVVCPEAPVLDEVLYNLTRFCATAEHTLDDDLRASMAFSEAML